MTHSPRRRSRFPTFTLARPPVTVGGSGIVADDAERVFGRFQRAAPTRTFGGFGLGLWIARQIASAHSGSIALAQTDGGGTSVTLTLPATRGGVG